jgi:hypothetical protein
MFMAEAFCSFLFVLVELDEDDELEAAGALVAAGALLAGGGLDCASAVPASKVRPRAATVRVFMFDLLGWKKPLFPPNAPIPALFRRQIDKLGFRARGFTARRDSPGTPAMELRRERISIFARMEP